MDKKKFQTLRSAILVFAKIHFFQISEKTKQPTGLFCSCYTHIKKDIVLERIKQIIEDLKLPFLVEEKGYELTHHFLIKF